MRLIQILAPLAIEPSPKLARWLNKKPNQRRVRQIALANSSNLNADRIVVLRLGLGRDSMAMLVLLAAGELVVQGRVIDPTEVDAVVFTDPGHEWSFTYDLIPRVQSFCDRAGLRFLVQKKPPAEGPDGWIKWIEHQTRQREKARSENKGVSHGTPPWRQHPPASIEARCASGYYHHRAPLFEDYGAKDAWIAKDDSSCTINHKVMPMRELLADLQAERFGVLPVLPDTRKRLEYTQQVEAWQHAVEQGRRRPHLMLIGYAADELARLKEVKHDKSWENFDSEAYPLMEMNISKADEQAVLNRLPGVDEKGRLVTGGFAEVRKSGCMACKEQDVAQFWMLSVLDPVFFQKIVEHEKRVVARTGPWQAIFPRKMVATIMRKGEEINNPEVTNLMAEKVNGQLRKVGFQSKGGRVYAYPWYPLQEKVQQWQDRFVAERGRMPTVDEVARKEYRGCPIRKNRGFVVKHGRGRLTHRHTASGQCLYW